MSEKSTKPEDKSPEKPGNDNKEQKPNPYFFAYLLLGGIIFAVLISAISISSRGTKVEYSDFVAGLNSGKYTKKNVHDLMIYNDYIIFSNKSKEQKKAELTPAEKDDAKKVAKEEPTKSFNIPISSMPQEVLKSLSDQLLEKGIKVGYAPPSTQLQDWFLFMLFAMTIVFIIVAFRRMGGAGAAVSFGRSRGRLYAQEDVHTTFDSVAGINEAVEELREIVAFLKSPEKYQSLGGRIPRGVLLVGPPGTGKTLLAKAVAGEAGVPFYGLSGSDFVELYVGVGAARVRDMFVQAGQRSPSIIFIDELDALGKVRGGSVPGGQDEREQTLNALLVEMDGFSSDQSVVIIGATNRPETLDPALLRPGRFDRHVLVDKPDYKGRESILKVHAAKVKMDETVDFTRIAKLTPGFSGADLASLVNEAALLAARLDKKRVSMKEFEESIERVVAGLEKTSRIISPDEKQRVAYHECGHALVATSLPHTDPVHKISIIPRGLGALGYMLQSPQEDRHLVTQSELANKIAVLLGGIAAEDVIYQEISTGASNDLERATDIARRMVTEFGMSSKMGRMNYNTATHNPFLGTSSHKGEYTNSEATIREVDLEIKRMIDETMTMVVNLLKDRREILENLAKELIEQEVMDSDQLHRIVNEHQKSPFIKPGTTTSPSTTSVSSSTSQTNEFEQSSGDKDNPEDQQDVGS